MKNQIKEFTVFSITDDSELIEEVLGNDDVPDPESRFLVVKVGKNTVEVILEDYDGKFDLDDTRFYFSVKDFKKIAKFEGTISRGNVNTF